MNNITDLIFALATAAIPVIGAWATKQALTSKKSAIKAKTAIDVSSAIVQFAQQAVVNAEQIGNKSGLFGEDKKQVAIKYVQNALNNLHITSADLAMVSGAVEQAFLDSKNELEKAYPRTEEKADDSTNAPASPIPSDIGDKLDKIADLLTQQNAATQSEPVTAPANGDDSSQNAQEPAPADNTAKNVQG